MKNSLFKAPPLAGLAQIGLGSKYGLIEVDTAKVTRLSKETKTFGDNELPSISLPEHAALCTGLIPGGVSSSLFLNMEGSASPLPHVGNELDHHHHFFPAWVALELQLAKAFYTLFLRVPNRGHKRDSGVINAVKQDNNQKGHEMGWHELVLDHFKTALWLFL